MPSASLGSLFMFLISTVFPNGDDNEDEAPVIGWENPEVIYQFKIIAPSKNGKVPEYLTAESSKSIAEYINYVKGLPRRKRLEFLENGKPAHHGCYNYRKWFLWPLYKVFSQWVIDSAGKWALIFVYMPSQADAALLNDSVNRLVKVILCLMKNLLFCMFLMLLLCQLVSDLQPSCMLSLCY